MSNGFEKFVLYDKLWTNLFLNDAKYVIKI